ncbi:inverse autotransporter beta domain-containing protein [Yersinia enterocolitica]|uniref:inverse autotransporter beta domain-containing protein n=2 Tax=Yersinia enterocolitica TaxID=630 RepID=UPI00398D5707
MCIKFYALFLTTSGPDLIADSFTQSNTKNYPIIPGTSLFLPSYHTLTSLTADSVACVDDSIYFSWKLAIMTQYQAPVRPPQHPFRPTPLRLMLCAWLNIGVQAVFPLTLAFTPAIGNANSPPRFVEEALSTPRPVSPFSVDNDKNTVTPPTPDNALARYAQTGAAALASGDVAHSGERLLRSAASNEFNSAAQQWLSQFGTARVQMNVNDDFNLEGSALDVLVPLYDNQTSLLFTQLGARHKDSRNTVNIGAGVRAFLPGWMVGANTFFDNDLTGKNRRIGVGAEAWTDYLKLSANSYFGTTDWHQSRDFADYNERPANGYDIRAEAYLPAYPQLGGKLMYEQYRGEEVALFGKDNRQKYPYAVTAGLNYTPIPLVTVGAEHRAGKGSQHDSRINLQLTYRPGASWQSHIDPLAVASSRTLAGSRHDLVERNNDIVLDYQKQELVRVTLPAQVSGEAGSTTTVTAQVNSKYGLARIEWDSASLVAAGGTLTSVSPQAVALRLPAYVPANNSSSNVHTVGAIAYDRQGNASSRVTMQLTVITGTVSAPQLTVTTDNALANGSASNGVQAIVTDANGNPVVGEGVSFSASNGASLTTVIGTTGADGKATATLTNITAGISTVTATLGNGASATVDTTFVVAVLPFTDIAVNGTTFAVDAGFPSTGFTGAEFTLNASGQASDYTWSSSSSWATVDGTGKVRFTQKGNATPVTITATPTAGGTPLSYTFTVSTWFINNGSNAMVWSDAAAWCTSQTATQPTRVELTQGQNTRGVGSLGSEWGQMSNYSSSGFGNGGYWTSEADGIGYHYVVFLNIGIVISGGDSFGDYVVCRQGL